jgi:hypothetical protein
MRGRVAAYQTARLKEGGSPKTINEEVGLLLRLLAELGDGFAGRDGRVLKMVHTALPRAVPGTRPSAIWPGMYPSKC